MEEDKRLSLLPLSDEGRRRYSGRRNISETRQKDRSVQKERYSVSLYSREAIRQELDKNEGTAKNKDSTYVIQEYCMCSALLLSF